MDKEKGLYFTVQGGVHKADKRRRFNRYFKSVVVILD